MVVFCLLWVAITILMAWPFNSISIVVPVVAILGFCGFLYLLFSQKKSTTILLTLSLYSIIGINLFLNSSFYPSLLQYQAGSNIGRFISDNHIPINKTIVFKYDTFRSLDFYAKGTIKNVDTLSNTTARKYVILSKKNLSEINATHQTYKLLYECPDYPITLLSLRFLNPQLRPKELETIILIQLN